MAREEMSGGKIFKMQIKLIEGQISGFELEAKYRARLKNIRGICSSDKYRYALLAMCFTSSPFKLETENPFSKLINNGGI